ncbi:MAG: helix-turn-helix domain-containing protein [Tepidisphaeraceae bacterium]
MTPANIQRPKLLDDPAATEYLGLRPGTLSVWRCTRRYPLPYLRVGRSIKYRVEDLDRFLQERTVGAAK